MSGQRVAGYPQGMIVEMPSRGRQGLVMDSMVPEPTLPGRLTIGDWQHMRRLLALRVEQGELSAVERRIADYLVESGHLIRDQSSQQLATTLDVSQSSVVKFAKRLGFRGYPDMKLSISEALARATVRTDALDEGPSGDADRARAERLTQAKAAADDETRALNAPATLAEVADWIAASDTLFVAGDGADALVAQGFAGRCSLLGRRVVACLQPAAVRPALCSAGDRDLLLMICERPGLPEWVAGCRDMRAAGGRVVVVSRERSDAMAGDADACLVVSAHAAAEHLADMLYESALRQLLDDLFLRVVALEPEAAATFASNRRRCRGTGP